MLQTICSHPSYYKVVYILVQVPPQFGMANKIVVSSKVPGHKYRSHLHDEASTTQWRYGGPPIYDVVNKLFEEGRTKVHTIYIRIFPSYKSYKIDLMVKKKEFKRERRGERGGFESLSLIKKVNKLTNDKKKI